MKYGYDDTDVISNTLSFTRFLDYEAERLQAHHFQSLRTPAEKESLLLPYFSSQKLSFLKKGDLFLSQKSSLVGFIPLIKSFISSPDKVSYSSNPLATI